MAKLSNIFVDRGASFSEVIDLKNDDGSEFSLSSYTVSGSCQKHQDSLTSIPFDISTDLSTNNITFSLSPEQTAILDIMTYIFSVYVTSTVTGKKDKVAGGNMIVSP